MELVLIVAHDKNLVIGNKGELPWRIPEDLKHFKKTTMGSPILMGRGVFDEIGRKPLPGRRNVVLSSQSFEGAEVYSSTEQALKALENEQKVFVIGGGQVYRQLLDKCVYMYVTEVHGEYEGDVFFPEYRHEIGRNWLEVARGDYPQFSFIEYKRI